MSNANEAMSRYASGEAGAFHIVYELLAPKLEQFLRRKVREMEMVKDIAQQTFLQMHSARGTFIPGSPVLPWAYAIARRLLIDRLRKRLREHANDTDVEAALPPNPWIPAAPTGEDMILAREREACLLAAYKRLTANQRAAFDLVADEGLSYGQAACILGTTVMAIKLRVRRVYIILRAALVDAGVSLESGRP